MELAPSLSGSRGQHFGAGAVIRAVPAAGLERRTLDAMWAIYGPHHQVPRARMEERLEGALDRVHLFYVDQQLVGFLGTRLESLPVPGQGTVAALYMGLGFILPAHRSRSFVQRAMVGELLAHWRRSLRVPLYLWTDALSYKPYLLIARNMRHYCPHRTLPDPTLAVIRDTLGQRHYGEDYQAGTVRKPSRLLAPGVADIRPEDLLDPDVRFYAEQNPRHQEGDGLLVVAAADLRNVLCWLQRSLLRATHARR